jgi:hypothetical protein
MEDLAREQRSKNELRQQLETQTRNARTTSELEQAIKDFSRLRAACEAEVRSSASIRKALLLQTDLLRSSPSVVNMNGGGMLDDSFTSGSFPQAIDEFLQVGHGCQRFPGEKRDGERRTRTRTRTRRREKKKNDERNEEIWKGGRKTRTVP